MKKLLLSLAAIATLTGAMAVVPSMRKVPNAPKVMRTAPTAEMQRTLPRKAAAATIAETDEAQAVPVSYTLGKNDKSNETWLQIDANNDGRCFTFMSTYAVCQAPNTTDFTYSDDWFVSPAIKLEAGKTYKVTFEASGSTQADKSADWALYCGTARTAAGMTNAVSAKATYAGKDFTKVEETLTVDASGSYFFGFHCTTDKNVCTLSRIKDFKIEEAVAPVDAPAAGTLSWELAPKGELKATLTYVAPTKTQSGADLTQNVKVEIRNWVNPDWKLTFEDVAPGATVSGELQTLQGSNNKFFAVAYLGEAAGDEVSTDRVFSGIDTPLAPENVVAKLNDDYTSVTLTWDAVGEVGENGGYVDPANVVYYIFDAFGSYYDPALGTTDQTSVEISYTDLEEQDFVAFQVTAGQGDYYSLDTNSNIVVVGKPDSTPWHESFTDAYYQQLWAVEPGSTNVLNGTLYDNELQTNYDDEEADPEYLNSHDADNGFFIMLPMNVDDQYGLLSTKIDISKAAHPVFEFFYQGQGSELDALLAIDGGEFFEAKVIDLKENPTTGWTLCRVDLAEYASAKYIQVGLRMRAIHNTDSETWSVPVDNIRVIDLQEQALRVSYLDVPESVIPGEEFTVGICVENIGTSALENLEVSLLLGDHTHQYLKDYQEIIEKLEPNEVRVVEFPLTPNALWLDKYEVAGIAQSGDIADGLLSELTVNHSGLTGISNLSATAADEVISLTWNAPDYSALIATETVTDGFEDYEALTTYNFGDWIMLDRDGLKTYGMGVGDSNPAQYQPMAFQVYNGTAANLPEDAQLDMAPHSGENFLIATSAMGQNDNWLISPRLSGNAQTISFWAKSFSVAYPETFEVLYSTTGTAWACFETIEATGTLEEDGSIPEEWTEYTVALPEGAVYFAIRHTSNDSWALFIDDVTYEAGAQYPGLELTGYTIYRDDEVLTTTTEPALVDTPEEDGVYTYRVCADYNLGQSRASEPVQAESKRIVEPEPIEPDPVEDGIQSVAGATAKAPTFNLKGQRVNATTRGIYIQGNAKIRK